MHHAVLASGVSALVPVFFPVGGAHQFAERFGIAVVQKITGLLPAENRIVRVSPGGAVVVPGPFQKFKIKRAVVEIPALGVCPVLHRGEQFPEKIPGSLFPEEMLLIRGPCIRVSRGDHHAVHAEVGDEIEKFVQARRIFSLEDGGVGGDPEAPLLGRLDGPDGDVENAVPADQMVVFFLETVEMDGQSQVGRRLYPVQILLEKDGVRAEVDEPLPVHESLHDFSDFVVDQGFAARNGDDGGFAFFRGAEALLRRQPLVQDLLGILDLSASGAFQVAAEKRLQHENQGEALVAFDFLAKNIGTDLYGLMQGYRHAVNLDWKGGRFRHRRSATRKGERHSFSIKDIYQSTSLILGVASNTVKKPDRKAVRCDGRETGESPALWLVAGCPTGEIYFGGVRCHKIISLIDTNLLTPIIDPDAFPYNNERYKTMEGAVSGSRLLAHEPGKFFRDRVAGRGSKTEDRRGS